MRGPATWGEGGGKVMAGVREEAGERRSKRSGGGGYYSQKEGKRLSSPLKIKGEGVKPFLTCP